MFGTLKKMQKYVSSSATRTQKIAARMAQKILRAKNRRKKALIIALKGNLGAGKTTFVRGFVQGIIKRKIQSPTFVLMKRFSIPSGVSKTFKTIFHIDAYRLKNAKAAGILRLKELADDPSALILIEWPERIQSALPRRRSTIYLSHTSFSKRIIKITGI